MVRNRRNEQQHPADPTPVRLSQISDVTKKLRRWLWRWLATRSRGVLDLILGGRPDDDARLGDVWGTPGAFEGPPEAQPRRLFFFRFESHARAQADVLADDVLRRGGHVRLLFSDRTAEGAIQALHGSALDVQALEGGRLTLAIDAPMGIVLEGPDVVSACFESGRLASEPSFDLHVTLDCPASVALVVSFFARGLRLYSTSIAVEVRAEGETGLVRDTSGERRRPVDLDLHGIRSTVMSSMLLKSSLGIDGLTLTLFQFDANRQIEYVLDARYPDLGAANLHALLEQVRHELGPDFFDAGDWSGPTPGSPQWRENPALSECCGRVASAGWLLHQRLASTEKGRALLDHIEGQREGTRLTIATAAAFIPFELMYPQPFSRNWPLSEKQRHTVDPMRFWGVRFGIEIVHSGEGDYRTLRQRHLQSPRQVSMNLNAAITSDDSTQPREIHDRLALKLQGKSIDCAVNSDCEAMREALLAAATTAGVIYVYCHGGEATPFNGAAETLMLDFDCAMRPADLLPDRRFASAPVVILNACHSGAPSPLLFTGFLQAFRMQGALGVIATTFYVPILFGANFGTLIVDACLERLRPLGEELRLLRRDQALLGNPAPLFYSVQCQLDPF